MLPRDAWRNDSSSQNTAFVPHPLVTSSHLQTLWSRLARYQPLATTYRSTLDTPDGDFLDLSWNRPLNEITQSIRPLLVIFHGLEGSAESAYADQLLLSAANLELDAVVMHFRSCSGRLNRTARAYHSGETEDPRFFCHWLMQTMPQKLLFATGFSLGGNMLVKLLAESPELPIGAAAVVSAPLALGPSSRRMNQGFSKLYRNHLLTSLKQKTRIKLEQGQLRPTVTLSVEALMAIDDFPEFDDAITSPLHGFQGAEDYYTRCSGKQFLTDVRTPLLLIHAADDPLTDAECIPTAQEMSSHVHYELFQRGGHVGFITSSRGRPIPWLPGRLMAWFQQFR